MKNILIVAMGYYGRGSTIGEAFDNIRKAGARLEQPVILYIGKEELVFRDILQIEGEVATTLSFKRLSYLRHCKAY